MQQQMAQMTTFVQQGVAAAQQQPPPQQQQPPVTADLAQDDKAKLKIECLLPPSLIGKEFKRHDGERSSFATWGITNLNACSL